MIRELSVLIVEDDDVAAESITRGLRKVAPDIQLVYAEHGKVAIDILKNPLSSLVRPQHARYEWFRIFRIHTKR